MTVEERLAVLERRLSRYRLVTITIALVGAGLFAIAAARQEAESRPRVEDVIRTRRVEVINAQGVCVVELSSATSRRRENESDPGVSDGQGVVKVSSAAGGKAMGALIQGGNEILGPSLILHQDGKPVAELETGSVAVGVRAALRIYSASNGKEVATLDASEDGAGRLIICSPTGRSVHAAGGGPNGGAGLLIVSRTGRPIALVAEGPKGDGMLALNSGTRDVLVAAGVDGNGNGNLLIRNKQGKPIFVVAADETGRGWFHVSDGAGEGRGTGTSLGGDSRPTRADLSDATARWSDRARWRQLKTGMPAAEVRALLGEPQRIVSVGMEAWVFGSGMVMFTAEGNVDGWIEPQ